MFDFNKKKKVRKSKHITIYKWSVWWCDLLTIGAPYLDAPFLYGVFGMHDTCTHQPLGALIGSRFHQIKGDADNRTNKLDVAECKLLVWVCFFKKISCTYEFLLQHNINHLFPRFFFPSPFLFQVIEAHSKLQVTEPTKNRFSLNMLWIEQTKNRGRNYT